MARRGGTVKGRFYYILNMFMILMYALGGIVLFFWKMPNLPATNRYIISGVLLLYSTYRGIVLYRKFNDSKAEE
jgi:hypothetical protein